MRFWRCCVLAALCTPACAGEDSVADPDRAPADRPAHPARSAGAHDEPRGSAVRVAATPESADGSAAAVPEHSRSPDRDEVAALAALLPSKPPVGWKATFAREGTAEGCLNEDYDDYVDGYEWRPPAPARSPVKIPGVGDLREVATFSPSGSRFVLYGRPFDTPDEHGGWLVTKVCLPHDLRFIYIYTDTDVPQFQGNLPFEAPLSPLQALLLASTVDTARELARVFVANRFSEVEVAAAVNAAGYRRHKAGDAAGALPWFELAAATDPRSEQALYNAACAASRAGHLDAAGAHLAALKALGTDRAAKYLEKSRTDPDLAALRAAGADVHREGPAPARP
ncbi:MAG TPA: hypothetical protein VG389_12085 [Myxococcota bacterium]|nr:hypothetical protein [Myxococcota bacterium]